MGRVAALALAPGTHAALPVATARARLAPTTRVVVAPGRLVRFGLVLLMGLPRSPDWRRLLVFILSLSFRRQARRGVDCVERRGHGRHGRVDARVLPLTRKRS